MMLDLAEPGQIDLAPNEAKALVSEIIARYEPADEFDARAILEEHPGLRQYPSVVVDLAYEEFCRRGDAGEPADPQQFAQCFPDVAAPLLKLLEVHEYLDEHPNAFGAVPAPEWPEAGDEVGGFVLVREIGRGGFSRVFLARETDLGDRQVVLKICIQANEEAARLGQLDHPHIVPVHSVEFDSFSPFTLICMPFLGSATLADVVADVFADGGTRPRVADIAATIDRIEGRVGGDRPRQRSKSGRSRRFARRRTYVEAIIQTGAEVCEALAYAHHLGICHCDVKPSNVLLTSDGRPLLLDFNLSMQSDGTTAVVGGTLPYMAPEQLRYMLGDSGEGLPEIDHRTDLFALGVTLFQLLTGRLPFPTEDLPQDRKEAARRLLDKQRTWNDCRTELERVVSPGAARLIAGCMAFDRESRPESAEQVARQLRAELGSVARVRNWLRRNKRAAVSVALVLVMAAAASGIGFANRAPLHIRHFELGVSYLDAGDIPSAIRCFEGALDVHRDFPEAILLHGWSILLAAQNEPLDESKRDELLQSARDLFNTSWKRYRTAESAAGLASCHAELGDYAEARTFFGHAIDGEFATASVRNNLGYCQVKTNQPDAGIARLEEAIRIEPALQAAHLNLLVARCNLAHQWIMQGARVRGHEETARQCEAMALDHLQMARDQIKAIDQSVTRTAEWELAAARVYALSASIVGCLRDIDTDREEQDLLELALQASQAAISLHLPPQKLRSLAALAPELGENPRFQQLLNSDPPTVAAVPTRPLVDIYPDIRQRLGHVAPQRGLAALARN